MSRRTSTGNAVQDVAPQPLSTPTKSSRTPPSPLSSTAHPTPMDDTKYSRHVFSSSKTSHAELGGYQINATATRGSLPVDMKNVHGGVSQRLSVEVSEEEIIIAQIAKMLTSSELETGTGAGEGDDGFNMESFSYLSFGAEEGEADAGLRASHSPLSRDHERDSSWNTGEMDSDFLRMPALRPTGVLKSVHDVNRVPFSRNPRPVKRNEKERKVDITVSTAEMGNISDVTETSNAHRNHSPMPFGCGPRGSRTGEASAGQSGTPLESETSIMTLKQMLSKCHKQAVELRRAQRACYASNLRIIEVENQLKLQQEEAVELRTRLLLEREERRQVVAELSCRIEEESLSKSDLSRRNENLEKELRAVRLAHLQEIHDYDAEQSSSNEKIEALVLELREVEENWTRERTTLLAEREAQRCEAQKASDEEQRRNAEIEKLRRESKSLQEALALADTSRITMERKTLAKEKSLSTLTETVEALKIKLLAQESCSEEMLTRNRELLQKAEKSATEALEMRDVLEMQRKQLEEAEATQLSLQVSLGQSKQREQIATRRAEEMQHNFFALKKSTVPSEAADALQAHYTTSMETLQERMKGLEGSLSEELYRRRSLVVAVETTSKELMGKMEDVTGKLSAAVSHRSAPELPLRARNDDHGDDNDVATRCIDEGEQIKKRNNDVSLDVLNGGSSNDGESNSIRMLKRMSSQMDAIMKAVQSVCLRYSQAVDTIQTLETANIHEREEARKWHECAEEYREQVSNLMGAQRTLEDQLDDMQQTRALEAGNMEEARGRIRQYEIVLRRVVSELELGLEGKRIQSGKRTASGKLDITCAPSPYEETESRAMRPLTASTASAASTTLDSEYSVDDASMRDVDTTAAIQRRSESGGGGGGSMREQLTRTRSNTVITENEPRSAPPLLPRLPAISVLFHNSTPDTSLRRLVQVAHAYREYMQTTVRDQEAAAGEIRRLTVQLKAQERKMAEKLKSYKQKAVERQKQAEASSEEITSLQKRIAELESTCCELKKNTKSVVDACESQLRAVTTELTGELSEVAERVRILQEQKERLESDLESCKLDRSQLHRVLEALEEEVERRESESKWMLRGLQDVCSFFAVAMTCCVEQTLTTRFAQYVSRAAECEVAQSAARLSALGTDLRRNLTMYERNLCEMDNNSYAPSSASCSDADCIPRPHSIRAPILSCGIKNGNVHRCTLRAAVIAVLVCNRLQRIVRGKVASTCDSANDMESDQNTEEHERNETGIPWSVVSVGRCRQFLKDISRSAVTPVLSGTSPFAYRVPYFGENAGIDKVTATHCFSSEEEVRELLHKTYTPTQRNGDALQTASINAEEFVFGLLYLLKSKTSTPIKASQEKDATLLASLLRGHTSLFSPTSTLATKRGGKSVKATASGHIMVRASKLSQSVESVTSLCASLTDVLNIFTHNHEIIAQDMDELRHDLQRSKEQILLYAAQVTDIQKRASERCSASVADNYRTRIQELSDQLDKERGLRRRAESDLSNVQRQEIGLLAAKFDALREARSLTMELDVRQHALTEPSRNSALLSLNDTPGL